jgi:hypothetical protein
MNKHTKASRFLTELLFSHVYRKAKGIDDLTKNLREMLSEPEAKYHVALFLLHYAEDQKGKPRLCANVLLKSDSTAPGSCIQGQLTRGTNLALGICQRLGLVLSEIVPVSFTTYLGGLHITSDGVTNLGQERFLVESSGRQKESEVESGYGNHSPRDHLQSPQP